jgi:hypothetical protein
MKNTSCRKATLRNYHAFYFKFQQLIVYHDQEVLGRVYNVS